MRRSDHRSWVSLFKQLWFIYFIWTNCHPVWRNELLGLEFSLNDPAAQISQVFVQPCGQMQRVEQVVALLATMAAMFMNCMFANMWCILCIDTLRRFIVVNYWQFLGFHVSWFIFNVWSRTKTEIMVSLFLFAILHGNALQCSAVKLNMKNEYVRWM